MSIGQKLQEMTSGCRLEIKTYSGNRKFTAAQQAKLCELFGADAGSVSAGRQVVGRSIPEVKALSRVLREMRAYWSAFTVKYENGVRLIRIDKVEAMQSYFEMQCAELEEAKEDLYQAWDKVKEDAAKRLADLYVEEDYSFDVRQSVAMFLTFPAIEPDARIESLAPDLFEAERKRIAAKFQEAAVAAEMGLRQELDSMLKALVEKLNDAESEDGKRKVVQQRAVDNLVEFAERFKAISVSNDEELNALVDNLKQLAGGADVKSWKKNAAGKAEFAKSLESVKDSLEKMITDQDSRALEW